MCVDFRKTSYTTKIHRIKINHLWTHIRFSQARHHGGGGGGGRGAIAPYDFRFFFFFFFFFALVSSAVSHVHDDDDTPTPHYDNFRNFIFEAENKNVSESPPPQANTLAPPQVLVLFNEHILKIKACRCQKGENCGEITESASSFLNQEADHCHHLRMELIQNIQ